jgi:DNA-binding CsgD family transcriptional regulator
MTARRPLTDRQYTIIERLSRPAPPTQAELADELGISPQTLKNHLYVAYRTLGVATLGGAVRALGLRSPVRLSKRHGTEEVAAGR